MKHSVRMKRLMSIAVGLVLITAAVSITAFAQTYTGSLSTLDGSLVGIAGSAWATSSSVVGWRVSKNLDGTWHYGYLIDVSDHDVSQAIIEASNPFVNGSPDLLNLSGDFESTLVNTWTSGGTNPGMPGSVYGIKFESMSGTVATIQFDSDRAPVWGNIYAKDGISDGIINAIWNKSFLDTNPLDAPSNGSINNKILRPDSAPVPEPAALALVPMGLATFMKIRRKTTK